MKLNNQMIQWAVEALGCARIIENNKYNSEFNGYISSLGAAIVQSGLLPAMIFFENKETEAKDRYKVIDAIRYIINEKRKYIGLQEEVKESIAKYILSHPNDKTLLKDVTDSAVSLKLALRMFEKIKMG